MSTEEIIEVGKALLPYFKDTLTHQELGFASHDAVAALNRVRARTSLPSPVGEEMWNDAMEEAARCAENCMSPEFPLQRLVGKTIAASIRALKRQSGEG